MTFLELLPIITAVLLLVALVLIIVLIITQSSQRNELGASLARSTEASERQMDRLREAVERRLASIQEDNARKLEHMRRAVEEKLEGTLERRLGESFRLVSERLEQVHKGLGEMQTLASGVGDLKRVMTNVKTRGAWGEIQLGSLLEQLLSPEQFGRNVRTRPGSSAHVEYAVKFPGGDDPRSPVWMPIDAKFPVEDYQRLLDAQDRCDAEAAEVAARALEMRVRQSARDIAEKYLSPPATTDFAVMFLPTEGLFAEVIRRADLVDFLQREHRVAVAGPTTLAALLNSLQMGFRSLAIQQRSSEVWEVLGAVKAEFGKFGDVMVKVQKKLAEAGSVIEQAQTRTRVIEKKLRQVESVPGPDAEALLEPG